MKIEIEIGSRVGSNFEAILSLKLQKKKIDVTGGDALTRLRILLGTFMEGERERLEPLHAVYYEENKDELEEECVNFDFYLTTLQLDRLWISEEFEILEFCRLFKIDLTIHNLTYRSARRYKPLEDAESCQEVTIGIYSPPVKKGQPQEQSQKTEAQVTHHFVALVPAK